MRRNVTKATAAAAAHEYVYQRHTHNALPHQQRVLHVKTPPPPEYIVNNKSRRI